MKITFLRPAFLFLVLFILTAISTVRAGSLLGSELTYSCLAANNYKVKLVLFYDCATGTPVTNPSIRLTAPGCNTGRTIPMVMQGGLIAANPFCSAIPLNCGNIRPNYLQAIYEGTVVFSAADQTCPDWYLSFSDTSRARLANLVNSNHPAFYTEAYLNLTPGINNNSPQIPALHKTIEFVSVGQAMNLQTAVTETECDSLSYALDAPLRAAGVTCPHAPATPVLTGTFIQGPHPVAPYSGNVPPPIGTMVGFPATYLPNYPMPSINANWNAINPVTGLPYQIVPIYPFFRFDSLTGRVRFWPAVYRSTYPVLGDNKYAVVIKVTEWRKINGVMVKVGSIRREMVYIVESQAGGFVPEITNIQVNGKPFPADTLIDLQPGHNLQLSFQTKDTDSLAMVTLDTDVTSELPGATFTRTAGPLPVGTITWTGALVNNCHRIRYFHIQVKDNDCPVSTTRVYTFGVRVSSNSAGFRVAPAGPAFSAFPNPYWRKLSFRINKAETVHEIVISNLMGQEVSRITPDLPLTEGQEIDWVNADRFPAGQYLARFITTKGAQTIKFIHLR